MRHKVAGKKLGREKDERKQLRRNLITELFDHEKIVTTRAKAQAIRGAAEKMITLARNRGDAERLIELAEDGKEEELLQLLTDAQAHRLLRAVEENKVDELEREAASIATHAQRLIARDIQDREIVYKLFHEIAPRYLERPGGYTRVVKIGPRKGDAAEMVALMLVEADDE